MLTNTEKSNAEDLEELDFTDKQDFEDARRGFMAPLPENGVIHAKEGNPVWDLSGFSFIKVEENAPDTVNPSLWRQSQLLMQTGAVSGHGAGLSGAGRGCFQCFLH